MMTTSAILRSLTSAAALIWAGLALAQTTPAPVGYSVDKIFPESMAAGRDGTLYVGSLGRGAILRAPPGAAKADEWITREKGGFVSVLGVMADDAHGKLWVCSSDIGKTGAPVQLKAFDIKTGALIANYPFIESKGLCNDIAIAADGAAYASDTQGARVLRLKPGAKDLEIWATDPRLAGIDGLDFGRDNNLYVNNVQSGLLFRIEVKADGSAGAVTQLQTSRPLEGPDGMRATGDGRFVIAENRAGRIALGTINGDKVEIQTLREGLMFPAGVTVSGKTIWTPEGRFQFRADPSKDTGKFEILPIALPPAK